MKVHQKRLADKGKIEKLVDALRARRTNRLGGRFEQSRENRSLAA